MLQILSKPVGSSLLWTFHSCQYCQCSSVLLFFQRSIILKWFTEWTWFFVWEFWSGWTKRSVQQSLLLAAAAIADVIATSSLLLLRLLFCLFFSLCFFFIFVVYFGILTTFLLIEFCVPADRILRIYIFLVMLVRKCHHLRPKCPRHCKFHWYIVYVI